MEDDVFCGPSVVFTNVKNPRSEINQKHNFLKTMVKRGATVGANATIVCGVELGSYCFIGAGSLVSKCCTALVSFGVPARHVQWVDKHMDRVQFTTPLMSKIKPLKASSVKEPTTKKVRTALLKVVLLRLI